MESIDEILEQIDKSFVTTKDTIKEGIKKMYEYSVNVEKGMKEDPVFKDFILKSNNAVLEEKINEMLNNIKIYQEQMIATEKEEERDKASFHLILSSVTAKLLQEELDRRNGNKAK